MVVVCGGVSLEGAAEADSTAGVVTFPPELTGNGTVERRIMRPLGVGSGEPTAMLPLSAREDMASASDATDTEEGVDITAGR